MDRLKLSYQAKKVVESLIDSKDSEKVGGKGLSHDITSVKCCGPVSGDIVGVEPSTKPFSLEVQRH